MAKEQAVSRRANLVWNLFPALLAVIILKWSCLCSGDGNCCIVLDDGGSSHPKLLGFNSTSCDCSSFALCGEEPKLSDPSPSSQPECEEYCRLRLLVALVIMVC